MLATVKRAGLEESRDYTLIESPFLMTQLRQRISQGRSGCDDNRLRRRSLSILSRAPYLRKGMVWGQRAIRFGQHVASSSPKIEVRWSIFLKTLYAPIRWYMDPANHKEAVAIVAAALKRPPEQYDSCIFTAKDDFYRAPDLIPKIQVLQKTSISSESLA